MVEVVVKVVVLTMNMKIWMDISEGKESITRNHRHTFARSWYFFSFLFSCCSAPIFSAPLLSSLLVSSIAHGSFISVLQFNQNVSVKTRMESINGMPPGELRMCIDQINDNDKIM